MLDLGRKDFDYLVMQIFRSNPIKFNEAFITNANISDDIQILRVGTFFHEGQTIEITKKHLKSMIENYKKNVRGIDLMLDYSHESDKEAAAWFQDLYLSEDGQELWAKVDWTEDGADAVRKKKYRYISADFNFAYKDNETLKEHGPTLLGAGLTNRPVVKKMNPTILSEENNQNNRDEKMNLEEMKKKFADMEKKYAELQEENKDLKKKLEDKAVDKKDSALAEKEQELADREKAVKLAEDKMKEDKMLAEKKEKFDALLSEGKAVEAQREAYMKDDFEEFTKNAANAKDLNLSEKGSGKTSTGINYENSETPAQDEVLELAEKKVSEKNVDIEMAIDMVLSENPKLHEKYEKEVAV